MEPVLRTIAIIPARGGSRRVPRKNLQDLGGIPLLAWTVFAAQESRLGEVYVTTEDDEIAAVARELGARVVRRPHHLSLPHIPSRDVVKHAGLKVIDYAGMDMHNTGVFLLHPTSPFRMAREINDALDILRDWPGSVVATTNDAPNGSIYAARWTDFRRCGSFMRLPIQPYEMDRVAGHDIDTPEDLEWARRRA